MHAAAFKGAQKTSIQASVMKRDIPYQSAQLEKHKQLFCDISTPTAAMKTATAKSLQITGIGGAVSHKVDRKRPRTLMH